MIFVTRLLCLSGVVLLLSGAVAAAPLTYTFSYELVPPPFPRSIPLYPSFSFSLQFADFVTTPIQDIIYPPISIPNGLSLTQLVISNSLITLPGAVSFMFGNENVILSPEGSFTFGPGMPSIGIGFLFTDGFPQTLGTFTSFGFLGGNDPSFGLPAFEGFGNFTLTISSSDVPEPTAVHLVLAGLVTVMLMRRGRAQVRHRSGLWVCAKCLEKGRFRWPGQ